MNKKNFSNLTESYKHGSEYLDRSIQIIKDLSADHASHQGVIYLSGQAIMLDTLRFEIRKNLKNEHKEVHSHDIEVIKVVRGFYTQCKELLAIAGEARADLLK